MKKCKFILKKIQYASVDEQFHKNETVGDVLERIEKLSEEEIGFGEAEYHLHAIIKEEGKVSKLCLCPETSSTSYEENQ